jgi:hypothetical protein
MSRESAAILFGQKHENRFSDNMFLPIHFLAEIEKRCCMVVIDWAQ